MAIPLTPGDRDIILLCIARSTNGASLEQITAALPSPPDENTLQRWLDKLVNKELILPQKIGRELRYVAVDAAALLATLSEQTAERDSQNSGTISDVGQGLRTPPASTQSAGSGDPARHDDPAESPANSESVSENSDTNSGAERDLGSPGPAEQPQSGAFTGVPAKAEDRGSSQLNGGSVSANSEAVRQNAAGDVEATPPATPARDPVDELLDEAIPYIVADCGVPLSGARTILRKCARSAKLDGAAMSTFMDRAMAILSSLTEDLAAAKYGIDAQEYAVWREHCRLADSSRDEPLQAAPSSIEPLQSATNRDGSSAPSGDQPLQTAPNRDQPDQMDTPRPAAIPLSEGIHGRRNGESESPLERGGANAPGCVARTPSDNPPAAATPATPQPGRTAHSNPSVTGTSRSTFNTPGLGGAASVSLNSQPSTLNPGVNAPGATPNGSNSADVTSGDPRIELSPATVRNVASLLLGILAGGASARWTQNAWITTCLAIAAMALPFGYGSLTRRVGARERGVGLLDGAPRGSRRSIRLRKRATIMLGAGAVLVAGVIGVVWALLPATKPSNDEVKAYLVKSLLPLPVKAETVHVVPGENTAMGLNLTYDVRFLTTEPLYRRVDTMEYLKAHAATKLAAIEAAEAILKGANGGAVRARMEQGEGRLEQGAGGKEEGGSNSSNQGITGGTPVPRTGQSITGGTPVPRDGASAPAGSSLNPQLSSLNSVVLVTTQTPAGATAMASGRLLTWKRDGAWQFSGDPVRIDRATLAGEPKPEGAFVIDAPADEARLKVFLSEQVNYASRVQAAAKEFAADAERQHQQRVAAFADLLRVGTMFTGTASGTTTGGVIRIALEIATGSAASSRVTALLRNDGGWSDARLFQGEWSVAADGETCSVVLHTGRDDRIIGAGPLLDDARDITVTLQLRPDGTASGVPDNWQLKRVEAADVGMLRAGFSRAVAPALTATQPGLVYRGTITAQGRPTNEVLMLRFTAREPDGTRVEASLQSATVAAWSRSFRGSIVDNTYRAGSTPIRLRSQDADRITQAPTWSMLFLAPGNNSVALNLRVDGTRLVGQDDYFTYVFEPADPSWTPPPAVSAPPSAVSSSSSLNSQPSTLNSGAPAPGGRALPPFPGNVGAYVLSDEGQWVPLPRNNGRIVQSLVQKGNDFFGWLKGWEGKIAGTAVPDQKEITAQWMFDGGTPVPVVSGDDVVVIYAGVLMIDPKLVAKYPQLQLEPLMEMAPLWWLDSGIRSVPLTSPAPKLYGFGPLRVPATVERPALAITMLHCTTRLPARHYAVACGGVGYELAVQ